MIFCVIYLTDLHSHLFCRHTAFIQLDLFIIHTKCVRGKAKTNVTLIITFQNKIYF